MHFEELSLSLSAAAAADLLLHPRTRQDKHPEEVKRERSCCAWRHQRARRVCEIKRRMFTVWTPKLSLLRQHFHIGRTQIKKQKQKKNWFIGLLETKMTDSSFNANQTVSNFVSEMLLCRWGNATVETDENVHLPTKPPFNSRSSCSHTKNWGGD